jgi:hypothetical protein
MAEYEKLQQSVAIQPVGMPDVQSSIASVGRAAQGMAEGIAQSINDVEDERLDAEKEGHILDIRNQLSGLKRRVLDPQTFNPNTAIKAYDQNAKEIISNVLAHTDKRIRSKVANGAALHAFQGRDVIANQVQGVETQQLRFAFYDAYHSKLTDASNLAFKAGTGIDIPNQIDRENAARSKAQTNQLVMSGIKSGLISGEEGSKLDRSFKQTLQEQSYFGGLQQAMAKGDPQEFLQKFEDTEHKDLDPDEKQTISLQMHHQIEVYKQQHGISNDKFNNSVDDLILRLQNGGDQISNKIERDKVLATAHEWFPDKYGEVSLKLREAEKNGAMVKATKFARPDVALQIAHKYAPNPNETNIADKTRAYNQALHIIENNRVAAKKDIAGYVASHPSVVAAKKAYAYDHTTDWAATMLSVQRQMGANENPIQNGARLSIVPNVVAQSVANAVHGHDPLEQVKALNSMMAQYDPTAKVTASGELIPGKHQNIIMNDLIKNGLPTATSLFYGMTQNNNAQDMVRIAAQALDAKPEELNKALQFARHGMWGSTTSMEEIQDNVKEQLSDYAESLQGYQGDTTGALSQVYDFAAKTAALLAIKGMDPEDAAEKAADAIINSNYDYDTINGVKYRYPKDMSKRRIRSAATYLGHEAVNADLNIPDVASRKFTETGLDPAKALEIYQNEVANEGYYETTPDNQGIQLFDKDGLPVRKADGTPFIAKFDDLNNSQSALSRTIDSKSFAWEQMSVAALPRKLREQAIREGGANLDKEAKELISHHVREAIGRKKDFKGTGSTMPNYVGGT